MLSSRVRWERARVAHGEPYETQPLSPPPAPCCRSRRSTGGVRPESPSPLRRCSMKPPLRTKSVGTKVSEAEFALLEERARGAGMRLGEWVREALLSAPAESQQPGPDSGEVALAEVLALRSLLLNLHFRSATGEPVSESEMRGLIERADGSKLERARERNIQLDGTNGYPYDAEGRLCGVVTAPLTGGLSLTVYMDGAEGNRVAKGTNPVGSGQTHRVSTQRYRMNRNGPDFTAQVAISGSEPRFPTCPTASSLPPPSISAYRYSAATAVFEPPTCERFGRLHRDVGRRVTPSSRVNCGPEISALFPSCD